MGQWEGFIGGTLADLPFGWIARTGNVLEETGQRHVGIKSMWRIHPTSVTK